MEKQRDPNIQWRIVLYIQRVKRVMLCIFSTLKSVAIVIVLVALFVKLFPLLLMFYPTAEMPQPTEKLNFLLIGKTGSGKSTSGNTILGKRVFKAGISANSITRKYQVESDIVLGNLVTVVDGPGLGDTEMSTEESVKMVIAEGEKALAACPEGFHAILITIRLGRHSEQDKETFLQLKAIFGENFIQKFGILLVTYGDEYKSEENEGMSFKEWCANQTGLFQELLAECSGRVILIDNKSQDRYVQSEQLEKLFEATRNKDKFKYTKLYSTRNFKDAQKERDSLLVKIREPELMIYVSERITDILGQLSTVQVNDIENSKRKLLALKDELENLRKKVNVEDNQTGVLTKLLSMIDKATTAVSASLLGIEGAIKFEEELKRMKKQLENQEFKNDNERREMENAYRRKEQETNLILKTFELKFTQLQKEMDTIQRRGGDGFFEIIGDLVVWFIKTISSPLKLLT